MLLLEIERRIQQEQHAATVLNVVLDRSYFIGRVVGFWAGDRDNGTVAGHCRLVEQRHRLSLIIVPFEQSLELREAVTIRLVESMLAASAHKAYFANTFQIFQECASDSLFGKRFRLFAARTNLHVSRSRKAQTICASYGRLLLIIDVLNVDLGRKIVVTIQNSLRLIEPAGSIDVSDRRVGFQILDQLLRLLRKREAFITSGVDGLVIAIPQPVDQHKSRYYDNGVQTGGCAVARLSCGNRILWALCFGRSGIC